MGLRARSFQIRGDCNQIADEQQLADFLRGVTIDRVETAYSDSAWQVLVLYKDDKASEESAQIASAVAGELKSWRREMARNIGVSPIEILQDDVLEQVAQYVPTTALELRIVTGGGDGHPYENEIVGVVRRAMDELA